MISVIIPTNNRSALLRETLRSIAEQDYVAEQFEVVVVDNGSTDDTKSVTAEFNASIKNIRYVQEPSPGLHHGRHRGMFESKGDLLVFADDDIVAMPSWLQGIDESFQRDDVALVGGKNIPLYEITPPDWVDTLWETSNEGRFLTYFSLLDFGDSIKEVHPFFIFGCNFAIRKKILVEIKGFHPDGLPQNKLKYRGDGETYVAERVKALGYVSLYNPKASIFHKVTRSRLNLEYVYKRAYAEGITCSYSDTRRKWLENTTMSPLSVLVHQLKRRLLSLQKTPIQKKIDFSFREGYRYHQAELKRDKNLLEWVLKDNYLSD